MDSLKEAIAMETQLSSIKKARRPGTSERGLPFREIKVQMVWDLGQAIPNVDPELYRWDSRGALMRRGDYGDTDKDTGWEIDHIVPVEKGGSDDLGNLQPLAWKNNRAKNDSDEGDWTPAVTTQGGWG